MDKYEVDGERHVKFSNVKLKAKVGGGKIRLENLFNGDQKLRKYFVSLPQFYCILKLFLF